MKYVLSILIGFLLLQVVMAYTANAVATGSVNVLCPFKVTPNFSYIYQIAGNIVLDYNAQTLSNCVINSAAGTLSIAYASNQLSIYSTSISAASFNSLPTAQVSPPINALLFTQGNYLATISLAIGASSNTTSGTARFAPASQLVVSGFSATSVPQGNPVVFAVNVANNGLSASNTIMLNLQVTGPSSFSEMDQIGALSPGQNEQVSMTLTNAAPYIGTYTATVQTYYVVQGAVVGTSSNTVLYTVSASSGSTGQNPATLSVLANLAANTPSTFYYQPANAFLTLTAPSAVTANIIVSNVTSNATYSGYVTPVGKTPYLILRLNATNAANVILSANLTLGYTCDSLNPLPYELVEGSWSPITPFVLNSSKCTVMVTIPADPVVAIFVTPPPSGGGGGGGGGGGNGGGFGSGGGAGGGGQGPSPSSSSTPTPSKISIPQISFESVPYYATVAQGSTIIEQFSFKNIGNSSALLNFSIPKIYASVITLSQTVEYLTPGQNANLQVLFNAQNLRTGTYIVPVNITLFLAGSQVRQSAYFTFFVYNNTIPTTADTQVYITQGNATVNLFLRAPAAETLNKSTVITILNPGIITSLSQIQTFGLPSNVTDVDGYTVIKWFVNYLYQNQTTVLSYRITNPNNTYLIRYAQTTLVAPSIPSTSSILRIINTQLSTFYTDEVGKISFAVLYTGTASVPMKFVLSSPTSVAITNATQIVNVTPNQLVTKTFYIKTGSVSETVPLDLVVSAGQYNISYNIPVIVLPPTVGGGTGSLNVGSTGVFANYWTILGTVVMLVIIAGLFLYRRVRRGKIRNAYRPEDVEKLVRIRENIKEADEDVK